MEKVEKLELLTFIKETVVKAARLAATQENRNMEDAEFTVVQQLADGQGIIVKFGFDESGERDIEVSVSDSLFVLEKIDNTLDIFEIDEEGA